MKNKLARVLAVTLLLCLALSGCSRRAALKLADAEISQGVFAYYLDKVMSDPRSAGLDEGCTDEEMILAARDSCISHIAVNSICLSEGFTLSNIEKANAAENAENRWAFFGDYYESIGVTRQDFTCVTDNEAKKAMLIEAYYGEAGKTPVPKSELVSAFNETHVGFRAITGYLTAITAETGGGRFSESELEQIHSTFEDMAKKVNSGSDIEKLNKVYNESQGLTGPETLSTIVIDANDTTYAKGFFDEVAKTEIGKATVVSTNSYIYVILRTDISGDEYVSQYKTAMLELLRAADLDELISEWSKNYSDVSLASNTNKIFENVCAKHESVKASATAVSTLAPTVSAASSLAESTAAKSDSAATEETGTAAGTTVVTTGTTTAAPAEG